MNICDTWYKGQALLTKGVDLSQLITHKMPLEDIEKGLQLMIAGECGKVILYP
jgi:threonine 3-dehydrogenase